MLLLPIILACSNLLVYIDAANILYVMPFTSKSHNIMLRPIGLELARRGHNVTVITGFKESNPPPNYRQVVVDNKYIWDVLGIERPNVFSMLGLSDEEFQDLIFWRGGIAFTEVILNSTEVRDFLKEDNQFDLIINEQFFQEAMYTFSHKYGAPFILVTTFGTCMRHNILTRNPLQLSSIISEFIILKEPRSFLSRLRNFYFTFYEYFWWKYWYLPKQEELARKYIPNLHEPVPSLYDIQRNVSLMLVNRHFSFEPPVALLPNIIEIGGMHLTHSDGKLPKDLQLLLDNATQGVVYMSFGSNVQSSELPKTKVNAFLNVFKQLGNYTILWKWEDDELKNIPKNVVIRKWLPQKEIFAHPNTKVFISHGGLIGTQEAIFHGIPIIGIPVYADQYNNLLRVQEKGVGKILQYHDITEQNFENMLTEVLEDTSYVNKSKELSMTFRDRPMSALDTSIFWIEYVMRHKGAGFIKNPTLEMTWIEANMIDVYALVFLIFVTFVYIIFVSVKFLSKFKIVIDHKGHKKHQ